jgi:hypothetical protein
VHHFVLIVTVENSTIAAHRKPWGSDWRAANVFLYAALDSAATHVLISLFTCLDKDPCSSYLLQGYERSHGPVTAAAAATDLLLMDQGSFQVSRQLK